ncbi:MAG TPA: hypothetical protein VG755_30840 [Nannocystaceae bacterium]|nr:hypothetical protein [Nannocystaceae bacterium]
MLLDSLELSVLDELVALDESPEVELDEELELPEEPVDASSSLVLVASDSEAGAVEPSLEVDDSLPWVAVIVAVADVVAVVELDVVPLSELLDPSIVFVAESPLHPAISEKHPTTNDFHIPRVYQRVGTPCGASMRGRSRAQGLGEMDESCSHRPAHDHHRR